MGNRHGTDGAPKFNDEMIAEFCKTSGMTENQVQMRGKNAHKCWSRNVNNYFVTC